MKKKNRISRENLVFNNLVKKDVVKNITVLVGGLFLLSFIVIFSSCNNDPFIEGIKGKGPTVSQKIYLQQFSGVELNISADVYIKQGSEQSIKVEAEQNIINNIETYVRNNIWKIEFDERVYKHDNIRIDITIPNIRKLEINSSGDIIGNGSINTDNIDLNIDGSGDMSLKLFANSVDININGSGDIKLAGTGYSQNINIDGSGDVKAFPFLTEITSISVDGSGKSEVLASDLLNINIDGSGDVYYRGYPQMDININGSGKVHNSN